MDALSTSALVKLNQIDKALKSPNFYEQVEILILAKTFAEEHPFAYFVNSLMVRLAQTFRLAASYYQNQLRLRIVKLVEECRPYLNVVFSKDEIVREVIYVSHSTDPKARCLMLMYLGALAPIIYDNKMVHYQLLESLESQEKGEVIAAISASGEVAKFSYEYASAVVEKLSTMVSSSQTDYLTKLRVINIMANFKENFEVTKKCMVLSNELLCENFDNSLRAAILMALTNLAYRSSLGVSEQITLLFEQLYKAVSHRSLSRAILRCLQRLAYVPHHWSPVHVVHLLDFVDRMSEISDSNGVILSWLKCVEVLTLTEIHTASIKEKLDDKYSLLKFPDLSIRISAIRIFRNILLKFHSMQLQTDVIEALVNTCDELRSTSQKVNKRKFYKLLTDYLNSGRCPESEASKIMFSLLRIRPDHVDFPIVLECLNAVCDSDPRACSAVSQWAHVILSDADFSRPPSISLISLLLLPVELNQEKIKILFDKVVDYVDDFTIYRIARTAFRNGHWKSVAAPLLESINEKGSSKETKNWMLGLTKLAYSQVTSVDMENFSVAHNSLKEVTTILRRFKSDKQMKQNFDFCLRYAECLQWTYDVTMKILKIVSQDWFHEAENEAEIQTTISKLCGELSKTIEKTCITGWNRLYSLSFDAGPQTLIHIQLWFLYVQNLISLMQYFSRDSISQIPIAFHKDMNSTNRQFHALVFWMKSHLDQLWTINRPEVHKRVTRDNIAVVNNLLKKFWSSPIYVPRHFFQNIHRTTFKLNLLPQPKEKEKSIAITRRNRLPVTVEGLIQTNNPNRIERVQVKLVASSIKEPSHLKVHDREIELHENENYFKAQFLLSLDRNTRLNVHITFVDTNTKKTWEYDTTAELIVIVS